MSTVTYSQLRKAVQTLRSAVGRRVRPADGYEFRARDVTSGDRSLRVADVDLRSGPNCRYAMTDGCTTFLRSAEELIGLGSAVHRAERVLRAWEQSRA
jgi:hypothetical protein